MSSAAPEMCAKPILRRIISTALAAKPSGPYNQAVVADRTVYVSGMIGVNKDTNALVEGGVEPEAKQAFENLSVILKAAGSDFNKVVKATVFLNDINDFSKVNEIYKEYFTENYPARSTFQVGKLPLQASVEIEVVALIGDVMTKTMCSL